MNDCNGYNNKDDNDEEKKLLYGFRQVFYLNYAFSERQGEWKHPE